MSAHLVVLLLDLDAGELVGEVFAVGQRLRIRVRCLFGHGVDRRAAYAFQPDRVGVDRDEQVGLVLPGDPDTVVEAQELVLLARHEHIVAAVGAQPVAQLRGEGQRDVLLHSAATGPAAPPSMPPCPGSMTTVNFWPSRPVLSPRRSLFGVVSVEPVVCACSASASSKARCEADEMSATVR